MRKYVEWVPFKDSKQEIKNNEENTKHNKTMPHENTY
jgi:hypothetical protein